MRSPSPSVSAPFDQVVANEGTSEGAEFSVSLYGAGTDEDPIVDGFVVAAGLAAGSDERLDEGETLELRGSGQRRAADDDLSRCAETIEWFEPSGVVVQLGSDVLDLDELIALAETLIIEATEISLPNPPGDMQVLIDRFPSTDLPLPNSGWSLYAFDDGADQSRSLTGSRSAENGIHLRRAVFEADEAVDVTSTTVIARARAGDETFPPREEAAPCSPWATTLALTPPRSPSSWCGSPRGVHRTDGRLGRPRRGVPCG